MTAYRVRIFEVFERPKILQDYYVIGVFCGEKLLGTAFFPGAASLEGGVMQIFFRNGGLDSREMQEILMCAREEMKHPIQLTDIKRATPDSDVKRDYRTIADDVLRVVQEQLENSKAPKSHFNITRELDIIRRMLRVD